MGIPKYVCAGCHYKGKPIRLKEGSAKLEIILWICGIIPGLIYSIICYKNGIDICPSCKTPSMISVKGPHGQRLYGA